MAKYIFVLVGTQYGLESARSILRQRAARGTWPLHGRTSNQARLQRGDEVLFYAAGKGDPDRGHIIATGRLASGRVLASTTEATPRSWVGLRQAPQYEVRLEEVSLLQKPVDLRVLVHQLSFVANKDRWGTALQGGIRSIPDRDYVAILRGNGRNWAESDKGGPV